MSAPVEWLKNTQEWLDGHGPKAWTAAMVLGFIFFWPVGLFLLFFMIGTNRMWKHNRTRRCGMGRSTYNTQTGNVAFDKYRDETLRRLEDEQQAFTGFLDQLRAAKDQAEFDDFMTNRARRPAPQAPEAPEAPQAPSGYTPPRAPGFGDATPA